VSEAENGVDRKSGGAERSGRGRKWFSQSAAEQSAEQAESGTHSMLRLHNISLTSYNKSTVYCLQSALSVFTLLFVHLPCHLFKPGPPNLLPISQPKAFLTRSNPSRQH